LSERDFEKLDPMFDQGELGQAIDIWNEQKRQDEKKHWRQNAKGTLEIYFTNKIIKDFIEQHFKNFEEPHLLEEKIKEQLSNVKNFFEGVDDTKYFLETILELDSATLKKFLKKTKKNKTKRIDYLSYGWTIALNIFTVFVVLAIFNVASTSFETIVFSLLVLVYLAIYNFFAVFGQAYKQQMFALASEFKIIRTLLHDIFNRSERQWESEDFEKAGTFLKKATIKFYLNAVFGFIIFLIVLYNLFGAL